MNLQRLIWLRDLKILWPIQRLLHVIGISIIASQSDLEYQLKTLIHKCGIDICIDIGAHHGEFIKRLRRINIGLRVIALEPSTMAFQKLLKNDFRNVDCYQLGISNRSGREILIDSGSPFASIKKRSTQVDTHSEEVISCEKLDTFVSSKFNLDEMSLLLKIDVQGSEMEVLKSGIYVLSKTKIVFMEAPLRNFYEDSATLTDVLLLMDELGFRVFAIHTPRFNGTDPLDCDVIFVRK